MAAEAEILVSPGDVAPVGLAVRRVPLDAPWDWLARGWRDLCAEPIVSLAYGGVFTALALAITGGLVLAGAEGLVPVLAGGFVLLGPLFAAGLYETSRRREAGEKVSLFGVFDIGSAAYGRLALFGVVLLFAFFAWVLIAFVLLMVFFGTASIPSAGEFVHTLLFTSTGQGLLFTGTFVGALLAAIVFSVSTVAGPLLLARDIDVVSAVVTSVRAVSHNAGPMLLWAALIAGFMAQGLATLFVGLIVAFPLLGYATWHAYRALIPLSEASAASK